MSLRRSIAALALLAAAAGATAGELREIKIGGGPVAQPELSNFQWALYDQGALVLVPMEEHLYPARIAGDGVIETLPLKIAIRLHNDGTEAVVPLHAVMAPWEVASEDWVLERQGEDGWQPAAGMRWQDGTFQAGAGTDDFEELAPGEYRFSRR